jgi:hypothetical protein
MPAQDARTADDENRNATDRTVADLLAAAPPLNLDQSLRLRTLLHCLHAGELGSETASGPSLASDESRSPKSNPEMSDDADC